MSAVPRTMFSPEATAHPVPTQLRRGALASAYAFVLLPYVIPAVLFAGHSAGGIFELATPVVVFGVIPLLDWLFGRDPHNPEEANIRALADRKVFRWITFLWLPFQIGLVLWGAYEVTHHPMAWWELLAFTLSLGVVTGAVGITFAHELCHKSNRLELRIGQLLLLCVSYMHFHIEHNLGHHVHVSTPKDPATSRLGESFYRFYPRTVLGSVRSAWSIECRRLQRKSLKTWSHHNRMLYYLGLPVLLGLSLGLAFGWMATPYFFAQSVAAFTLLEIVNYVEHYGLVRREIAPGRYEKVTPLHSWNANQRLTNGFLIMLQRHSDHHANPQRRYQTLRHFEDSPQLPTGYAGMVVLALIPPLWFMVMNRKVAAFRALHEAKTQRTDGGGRSPSPAGTF